MLNSKQIEIADFLLTHLASRGGNSSQDDYPMKLHEQGFNELQSNILVKLLIDDLNLIRYIHPNEYIITLTTEGNKAAKTGIVAYLDEIERDKDLDRKEKEVNIKGVKAANNNSVIAIVIATVIPILIALLQIYFEQEIEKTSNGDSDSKPGSEIDNSQFPLQRADTLFLEQLKESLKHDTVFLNEIKHLIEKK